MAFDPKLTKPHFSAKIYSGIIAYVEQHFPHVDVAKICEDCGLSRQYLTAPANWVSIEFARNFTDKIKQATGENKISYKAGAQRMSPQTISDAFVNYFSEQLPVKTLYQILPPLTKHFSKVTLVRVKEIKASAATIEISLKEEVFENDEERRAAREFFIEIYESTMGYYAAIPTLHSLPAAVATGKLIRSGRDFPIYEMTLHYSDIGFRFPFLTGVCVLTCLLIGKVVSQEFELPAYWALFSGALVGVSVAVAFRLRSTLTALRRGSEAMTHHAGQYNIVQRRKAASDRFVPWDLISLLGREDLEDVKIGDIVEKEVSVLFCDINNFSPISEELGPRGTLDLLNEFFACVCPEIRKHDGREVSFIFDEVVAVFQKDSADAIHAGCAILKALNEFNTKRFHEKKLPISVKIGINTGLMSVGVNGYENYMSISFASIEGAVGKRLQSLAKELSVPLLVGEASISSLKKTLLYPYRQIGSIPLKGVSHRAKVYQVLPHLDSEVTAPFLDTRDLFQQAVTYFTMNSFDLAQKTFGDVLKINASDKVAAHYLRECTKRLHEQKEQHSVSSSKKSDGSPSR